MKRPMAIFLFVLIMTSTGHAFAGPGFPLFDSASAQASDGPDGSFRPHDGAVQGDSWYVDASSGNDTNTGSEDSPFLTISRALEASSAGDTIVVRAGIYHEQIAPTDLTPSADRANPLTIMADPPDGASVTIDGEGVVPVTEGNLDAAAGISLYRDSSYIIRGFLVKNWTGYGLAVVQSSDVRVLDCTFEETART